MVSIGQSIDGVVETVAPKALNAGGVVAQGGKAAGRGSLKAGKLYANGMARMIMSTVLVLSMLGFAFLTGPVGWVISAVVVMALGHFDGVF